MEVWHIIFLALIQGVTEFLPISSSGHLILARSLFGWPDQGLVFDVAVHLGSLTAVIIWFRKDLAEMLSGCLNMVRGRGVNLPARLALLTAFASLPLLVAGFFGKDWVEANLRSSLITAAATAGFALLLLLADLASQGWIKRTRLASCGFGAALLIGLAQVFALVPGASRSGVTMTAGLFLGLDRKDAARFSFLLAMPAIAGASLLGLLDLLSEGVPSSVWLELLLGFLVSAVSSYVCIHLFLHAISRIGFLPFAAYRLLLGGLLLMAV